MHFAGFLLHLEELAVCTYVTSKSTAVGFLFRTSHLSSILPISLCILGVQFTFLPPLLSSIHNPYVLSSSQIVSVPKV